MLEMIFVFLYIGLFSVGGGMVAIPLIQQEVVARGWITLEEFYTMVAVAESTPGPIGINIATYLGVSQFGVLGALVATTSFILPSFIIVSVLSSLLKKHRDSRLVQNWFLYIKAAVVGFIGYALAHVCIIAFSSSDTVVDYRAVILFVALGIT